MLHGFMYLVNAIKGDSEDPKCLMKLMYIALNLETVLYSKVNAITNVSIKCFEIKKSVTERKPTKECLKYLSEFFLTITVTRSKKVVQMQVTKIIILTLYFSNNRQISNIVKLTIVGS